MRTLPPSAELGIDCRARRIDGTLPVTCNRARPRPAAHPATVQLEGRNQPLEKTPASPKLGSFHQSARSAGELVAGRPLQPDSLATKMPSSLKIELKLFLAPSAAWLSGNFPTGLRAIAIRRYCKGIGTFCKIL